MAYNKDAEKEFTEQVNFILWKEWNPIGCDVPEDEYTRYAIVVADMVWHDETREKILKYLFDMENSNMGLHCFKDEACHRNKSIVDSIFQLAKRLKKLSENFY